MATDTIMQKTIEINADVYKELKKTSLFFVKFREQLHHDNRGKEYDDSVWQSVDKGGVISFPAGNFGQRDLGYCLCIIDKVEPCYDNSDKPLDDKVCIIIHDATTYNENDCSIILNNCITRSSDKEDKFYFMELLWFLDKNRVNKNSMIKAINKFDNRVKPFVLDILRKICRCLSLNNQNIIKSVFDSFNSRYDVYMPRIITEALQSGKPSCNKYDLNIFQLVDEILEDETINQAPAICKNSENFILKLLWWLNTENALSDYNILIPVFSMVAEPIRLDIVKRYFHDIRLKNTSLDTALVSQFKDNKYDEFICYRYATETPAERVILTVPLLCDNILTLYNSKGKTFQTFDGILDFAITHCDKTHPGIDLQLDRFIPVCKNSAVYNSYFKGFIDYKLVYKLNKKRLTESFLLDCIRIILDNYGRREMYPVCKYANDSCLGDSLYAKCSQSITNKKGQSYKLECIAYKKHEDKWKISNTPENIEVLNSFIASRNFEIDRLREISIDINMVSLKDFRNFILSLPSEFENIGNEEFLIDSYSNNKQTYKLRLIDMCSDILRMRIFPQKGSLAGSKFDVFGIWKDISANINPLQLQSSVSPQYIAARTEYLSKEADEVTTRTIESLKKELGIQEYNGHYFELKYDKTTLTKIIKKYYFKGTITEHDKIYEREFLSTSHAAGGYRQYCAPKLSEVNNPAIDLPYFWCRGKECFHNNLEKQTLKETNDWHEYSLYHLIEIIGYPKLHKTKAGNEPDPIVWNFIAITNKAMQKFRRLKCRSCGHLMFTDKSSGFNRYNFFSCINPNCTEANKPIYLNFCYRCKKGLIDSRDTKQCPNGWYICPTCLACCDDELYERQAQRYILSNRPVPDRINKMLGHGHNDKGEYFCPDCGTPVQTLKDEHGHEYRGCPSCSRDLHLTIEDDYN